MIFVDRLALSVGVIGVSGLLVAPAFADEFEYQAVRLAFDTVVANVEVVTEDRTNFAVVIEPGSGEIEAPKARVVRNTLQVEGARGYRVQSCRSRNGVAEIRVSSGEYISMNAMPRVVVRAPLNADVKVEQSTIFGTMGDLGEADLSIDGCSRLAIASFSGDAEISLNGSGDLDVGRAVDTDLVVNGSGDVVFGTVDGDFDAMVNGSGDISVQAMQGEMDLEVNGSGDITIASGRATAFDVQVNGSGDIRFSGVAVDPEVLIFGSGDVRIAALEGGLEASTAGSGRLRIGN